MTTVSNKEDFKKALERRETQIIVTGQLAKEMRKKKSKKKKIGIAGVVIATACIAAIPFTGGASAAGAAGAMGLTAAGAAAGATAMSAAEIALLLGVSGGIGLGIIGLCKGYKVIYKPDGSVFVEPQYKN